MITLRRYDYHVVLLVLDTRRIGECVQHEISFDCIFYWVGCIISLASYIFAFSL